MPGKSYNARTVLPLGSLEYKLLMLDITQLSITSEFDMERLLRMQNMAQVAEALELYLGLEIFDPYSWPVDMLLQLILKTSSDKAARAA
ncbi:hypothetical protein FRC10_002682 [Ceratobasidium sp. 414]|nr:hypothetical protein FRC10_002682 [Ceratobasidium sp. 414]